MISKKNLKLLLKAGISALFIVFLFSNSDVTETLGFVAKSNHLIWLAGVLLYILGQTVCAYKWKLLATAAGFKSSVKDYIDYYFTGMFFNLFLPTTVGGDVIKCYYLSKGDSENRKAAAAYSVLAERVTGVAVLIWLAAIVMFLPISIKIPFAIKLFTVLISFGIIAFAPLFPVLCRIFKRKKWMIKFLNDINIYWQNPLLIVRALSWSLVFHLIIIAIHVLIGYAIGIKIPILYYFIIYPMSSLAGFLPVSFNGIGPREATYIYFLALIGIKSSAALAFGIFWFGIVLISSLIGGIFYLKGKETGLENEKIRLSEI
ncbi:MAG: lysylphosphatidylglycerol synthase transmembrane domain-containing protein [Candidatus Gastranaerophilales bacterium]|nr:lysylphosphatidylglycerol synthase transmembrane domain-containing protein [Candidatus Gastranaerophilales bacterium]